MKNSKRLMLASALIATALSCPSFADETSYEAQIGDVKYSSLSDAINAATSGQTITMLKDVPQGVGQMTKEASTKSFNIDFGNHTYSANEKPVGSKGYESQLFHLEKSAIGDNVKHTLSNGILNVTDKGKSKFGMLIQNYSDLTLDNMIVDGTNMRSGSYAMSNNNGNIIIKNSIIKACDTGVAFDVYGYADYTGTKVTLQNSDIYGTIEVGLDNATKTKNDAILNFEGNNTVNGRILNGVDYNDFGGGIINVENGTTNFNKGIKNDGIFTVKEGATANFTGNTVTGNGGAIYNSGTLNLNGKTTFTGNSATGSGGAIYNAGKLVINDSTFEKNVAGVYGGAIINQSANGVLTVENSSFKENRADVGGAITALLGSGKTTIKNSVFENNQANEIGALYLLSSTDIEDSTFIGNKSLNSETSKMYDGGGALWVGSSTTTKIDGSKFVGNTAETNGGAIAMRRFNRGNNVDAKLDIIDSKFISNSAKTTGGAIDNYLYNSVTNSNSVTIKNSEFMDNTANQGGAIFNHGLASEQYPSGDVSAQVGNITIEDTTFTSNTATGNGGAIYNEGTITLAGTNTFSGNKANNVANDIHNTGTLNLVGTLNLDGGITGDGTIELGANSLINVLDKQVATNGSSVINAGTLNIADGAQIAFDLGDTISATTVTGGKLTASDIYVSSEDLAKINSSISYDFSKGATINLKTNSASDNTIISYFSNGNKFSLTQNDKYLELTKTGTGSTTGLQDAVNDGSNTTTYQFTGSDNTQTIDTGKGAIVNGSLIISGDRDSENNLTIKGEALAVGTGKTLVIENVDNLSVEKAIENSGTTEVNNSSVSSITNTGTVNVNDGVVANVTNDKDLNLTFTTDSSLTTKIDKTVASGAKTTINVVNTNSSDEPEVSVAINNAVIEQTSLNAKGDGHLELIGSTIKANITNEMTGNTFVLDGSDVTGTFANGGTVGAGAHAQILGDTTITGAITNKGNLEILGSNFTINQGVNANTYDANYILYIGDKSKVTLANSATISNQNVNIENATLTLNGGSTVTGSTIEMTAATLNATGATVGSTNSIDVLTSSTINGLNSAAALNLANNAMLTANGGITVASTSFGSDSALNLANGVAGETAKLGSVTLNGNSNLLLDVNTNTSKADKVISTSLTNPNNNKVNLNVNVIGNAANDVNVQLVDGALAGAINYQTQLKETPIFKYETSYDATTGMLSAGLPYKEGGANDYRNYSPSVLAAPIAAQIGGFLNQVNSYEMAFQNMDMTMLMTNEQRQAMKMRNKYAAADNRLVDYETLDNQTRGLWFRPYASFEKVSLDNGPKVESTAYGTYFGGDSDIIELGNGWDAVFSGYVGYNGSHQNYDSVNMYQNGGNIGATAVFYKDNFFTGLTANAGASVAEASSIFGTEDITMLMAGIASKTGYNWELANGRFIIQPSWLMSYSFVNTFNYHNAANVDINSQALHAIQLAPGLKFIGNLNNGWQPYANIQMVWNIMDDTRFKANNVDLPQFSVRPYIQYGLGVQKRWGDRFTGFAQAMLRNGGRTGIAFSLGFKWALGKDTSEKAKSYVPEKQKTNVTLSSAK